MEELKKIRNDLMEKWNFFAKLGGEWNDGYFHAICDAIENVDDVIRTLERSEQKNKPLDFHHYSKSYGTDSVNWAILTKKTFWKKNEK